MPYLLAILLVGFILRFYGLNWDQGFHLHPDERALIMVTERVRFFNQLNPDFFNYGSLPIYLLKGVSQLLDFLFSAQFNSYQGMLYVGRYLSIIFDIGTVLLVYKIARLLFKNKKIHLYSSFFYAIAFFPIQNSHFFVVDVSLTFFTTLLIYILLRYIALPTRYDRIKMVVFLGTVFAAMLATKFTAIILLPIILLVLILKSYSSSPSTSLRVNSVEKNIRLIHSSRLARTIKTSFIYFLSSVTFYFIFMPYAFLEYQRFFSDITAQMRMNSDPYIFPYTLQYIGTLPYLYYLKNIFLWGLGPIISILSIIGFISFLYQIAKIKYQKYISNSKNSEYFIFNMYILFLIFYILYFVVIGRSAVKFMRYMLPVYPFFAIMAGYGLYKIQNSKLKIQNYNAKLKIIKKTFNFLRVFLTFAFLLLISLWTFMFINIYSQKHTRIVATEWMLKNIPKGSTLALEHWDDGLPLRGGENYNFVELTLYDQPDDELKWLKLNERLFLADYLIIASNRLYVPLQKLSDCKKYKSCYPKTAEYFRNLFHSLPVIPSEAKQSRGISFKKVAEFAVYPRLEVGSWKLEVNDQEADESFTVYDHPKIFIFKKT